MRALGPRGAFESQALDRCVMALTGATQAALIDRGGGMIYDTTLNITWLADMNYATTRYTISGGTQSDADGLVNWTTANNCRRAHQRIAT